MPYIFPGRGRGHLLTVEDSCVAAGGGERALSDVAPGGEDFVDRRAAEGVEGRGRRRRRRRRDRRVPGEVVGRQRRRRRRSDGRRRRAAEEGRVPAVGQLPAGGGVAQPLQLLLELPETSSTWVSSPGEGERVFARAPPISARTVQRRLAAFSFQFARLITFLEVIRARGGRGSGSSRRVVNRVSPPAEQTVVVPVFVPYRVNIVGEVSFFPSSFSSLGPADKRRQGEHGSPVQGREGVLGSHSLIGLQSLLAHSFGSSLTSVAQPARSGNSD